MNDLSNDIAEIRALTDTIWFIEEQPELHVRAYPYLIRILQEKIEALEDKYNRTFRGA